MTGDKQAPKKTEEKKKKEEKPKAPAPAKKEQEPVEEMDAAEAALAAEPKSKDPLDALPKGYVEINRFPSQCADRLVNIR